MCLTSTTLGEVSDRGNGTIRTGPFGSQLHESDYSDDGTPVVMPKNIVDGRVAVEGIARISDEHVARLAQHKLRAGDIVYGRRGDIGRRALITEREDGWLCGTGCLRISLGDSILDPAFLYYYLGQPSVIGWIQGQAIGATMPNLNTAILRSVQVAYPDIATQQRLAGILSAYDDLIENNTRRIAILEEMARSLYREWFVDFRFPGHDHVETVESAVGSIPDDWDVARLSDVSEFIGRGISPTYVEESDQVVLNQRCIRDRRVDPDRARRHSSWVSEQKRVRFGDVLINSTGVGTLGRVAQLYHDIPACTVDSHVSIVRPGSRVMVDFFGIALEQKQSHFESMGVGSTGQTELSRQSIGDTMLLIPPIPIQETFANQVAAMRKLTVVLGLKNRVLGETRDLLLPKLISGDVGAGATDISNVEQLEPVIVE